MLRIVVVCALVLRCHVIAAAVTTIRCRTPLGPKNGRVIYSSFEYGAELEYECDEGFILQNHQPRICNEDGIWSNDEPECIETCEEEPPVIKNGKSREFAAVNGSVVEYECEKGYELERHSSVQCAFGEWVGQPPICKTYGCVIPVLYHGDIEELKLGDYCWSWKKFRYERETTYVKGIIPKILARCYLKNLQNSAYVDVAATDSVTFSGNRLDVKCKEGYSLRPERPICLNGKWSENYISPCKENGCVIPVLHDGYIKKVKFGDFHWNWRTCRYERKTAYVKIPPGSILAKGSAVMLFCHQTHSFQGTSRRNQGITCLNGDWFPDPVCLHSIHACQMNKDETSHLIVDPEKDYYRSGDSITLSCPPGQKLTSGVEKMMCVGSTWSNTLPDCIEMTEPNLARLTTTKSQ